MLTSSQRDHLKRLAHHLKPMVFIGKQGLTHTVARTTDEILLAHEIVKIKFNDRKDEKREICDALAAETKSEVVGILGHIATLYRAHPDPDKRRIDFP